MLSKKQKILRMKGLGGSDMNALSGLSKRWRPIDVWRSKVDVEAEQCLSEDQPTAEEQQNVDTMRGDFLEPSCRRWYAHLKKAYIKDPGTRFHPVHKVILATADGLVQFADGTPDRGLEIKCPRFMKVNDWCHGKFPHDVSVPSYYLPQVTCEAAVLGVDSVDVAVLLGDELRIINVPFDKAFFESLLYLAEKFWRDYVVTRTPPPPDASASYHDYLRSRYASPATQEMLQADDIMMREARAYFEAGVAIHKYEDIQAAARNYLESRIQGARGVDFGPGAKVLWTNDSDKEVVDYKALLNSLNVSRETVEKFTTTKPGPRKFRPYFNGWKK